MAITLLAVSCATAPAPSGYPLGNGGKPLAHPGSVCVQIGPLNAPRENQGQCYQLSQQGLQEHVEPLPLDEFGYLFPPLKPQPKLAPAAVSTPPPTLAKVSPVSVPPAAPLEAAAPLATPERLYATRTLHFDTPVAFQLNSAHLARTNRKALTAFINSLEQYRGVESIRVTGHTDKSGPPRFNLWLSRMRAQSVRLRLLALGVDPRHLQVRGVGSRLPRPQAPNPAANRYVDIQVVVRVPVQ